MHVFLYFSEIGRIGNELQSLMEELFPPDQLFVLNSVENLSLKLQEPWEKKPIVVILVYKKDDLLDLVSLREQLHLIRLILVLPDAKEGTISLAHRFRPNYLTYIQRDLNELKAVLQKIKGSEDG